MDNYSSWKINFKEFESLELEEERIKFLLKFAVLAPSGHNTQPWEVKINKNGISIFLSKERRLPVGDPKNRLMYMSIGCFIENFSVAANYYGYKTNLKLSTGMELARVTLSASKKKKAKNHLVFEISKRVTNRNKYDRAPDRKFLSEAKRNIERSTELLFLTDSENKDKMAELAVNGNIDTFDMPGFREELSHHVKNNFTSSKTGMPAFGMNMPDPISFLVPHMIKLMNVNRMSKSTDLKLLKSHTPVLGLISTKEDKQKDWIMAGMSYEQVSLMASREGMATHPMAGPIVIPMYRLKTEKLFGTKLIPQMFFRLGHPLAETKHSPRIPADEIVIS